MRTVKGPTKAQLRQAIIDKLQEFRRCGDSPISLGALLDFDQEITLRQALEALDPFTDKE